MVILMYRFFLFLFFFFVPRMNIVDHPLYMTIWRRKNLNYFYILLTYKTKSGRSEQKIKMVYYTERDICIQIDPVITHQIHLQ